MLTPTTTFVELPELPAIAEFELRALRHDDVSALYDLLLTIEHADERDLVSTLADLQREFDQFGVAWRGSFDESHQSR